MPSKNLTVQEHSRKWHKQCFPLTSHLPRLWIRKWPLIANDQHSFLLCIISKATRRTKRASPTESSRWWLGLFPVSAATLARFCPQNSLVKGNMLHTEFDTHAELQTRTHRPPQILRHRGRDDSSARRLVWAVVKPDKSSNASADEFSRFTCSS